MKAPETNWLSAEHELALFYVMVSLPKARAWTYPEIDHYRVCYQLMCNWADIPIETAQRRNLRLMVQTGEYPCLGFLNGDVHDALKKLEQQEDPGYAAASLAAKSWIPTGFSQRKHWLSVVVTPGDGVEDELVYECYQTSQQNIANPAAYSVAGVWWYSRKGDPAIGAEVAYPLDEHNAFLY